MNNSFFPTNPFHQTTMQHTMHTHTHITTLYLVKGFLAGMQDIHGTNNYYWLLPTNVLTLNIYFKKGILQSNVYREKKRLGRTRLGY
jgi:hypothetical protein